MRFHCQFDYYPQPYEPNLYLRPTIVDVMCTTERDNEVVAAQLAFDYLDFMRAEEEAEHIYDVCDADSSGWESVYSALLEQRGDTTHLKAEFKFDNPIWQILFLHRCVFHPSLRDWQPFIIEHVSRLFGEESALVMWKQTTDMGNQELKSL